MIGQGVSSRSSHSAAAGRTTFSAKPWTQSLMSFWSWVSSSVNRGPSLLGAASPAASATTSSALAGAPPAVASVADMGGDATRDRVALGRRLEVSQVERAQPLGAVVVAVEEAPVDAVIGSSRALVGALDRERAVR